MHVCTYEHILIIAVICGSLPQIENGSLSKTPTDLTFGETATYECDNNYRLLGSATVTCQANMTWSTPPSCVGMHMLSSVHS